MRQTKVAICPGYWMLSDFGLSSVRQFTNVRLMTAAAAAFSKPRASCLGLRCLLHVFD